MSSTKKPGGKGQMKTDHLQSVSDKETDEAMRLGEEKPYHSERLPADPMKFLEMIEKETSHVPDMTRFRRTDEFISMARRFSEKYGIEAEIHVYTIIPSPRPPGRFSFSRDQLEWIRAMNSCRARAEEIAVRELILS